MAGKHDGFKPGSTGPPGGLESPLYPGVRVDKAYSEGRTPGALTGQSGHPLGSPEDTAYESGVLNTADPDAQVQTCWE